MACPWANCQHPVHEEEAVDQKFPWANRRRYLTHEERTIDPKDVFPMDAFNQPAPPRSQETSAKDHSFNSTRSSQDPPHRAFMGPHTFYKPSYEHEDYPPATGLKGVVIYCDAAKESKESGRYAAIEIASVESQLHVNDTPFDIPTRIGLPIWIRYLHDDPYINGINEAATCLHLIGDINNFDQFGSPSKKWRGSAVVAREDGVALLPQHLKAMVSFCKYVFRKALGRLGEGAGLSKDAAVRTRQLKTFQQLASSRGFLIFWKYYASERTTMDAAWRHLPSPYTSYKDELIDGEHYTEWDTSTIRQGCETKPADKTIIREKSTANSGDRGITSTIRQSRTDATAPRRSGRVARPSVRFVDEL